MAMTGHIAWLRRSSSMSRQRRSSRRRRCRHIEKARRADMMGPETRRWTAETPPSTTASGTAMKRRWGSLHDFTPPPADEDHRPDRKSTRYSQGHARNGKGVGHLRDPIVQGGPSPVTMSSTPARKSQRPAVVTLGCEVSWNAPRIILTGRDDGQTREETTELTSSRNTDWAVRASEIVRVRLTAVRVLLCRWWIRPPRPRDIALTARHAGGLLLEGGPVGLLRAINTATHELAREGSRTPFTVWLRHRLYRVVLPEMGAPVRSTEQAGHSRDRERDGTSRVSAAPVRADAGLQHRRALAAGGDRSRSSSSSTRTGSCALPTTGPRLPRVGEVLRESQPRDARIRVDFRAGERPHLGRVQQRAGARVR